MRASRLVAVAIVVAVGGLAFWLGRATAVLPHEPDPDSLNAAGGRDGAAPRAPDPADRLPGAAPPRTAEDTDGASAKLDAETKRLPVWLDL